MGDKTSHTPQERLRKALAATRAYEEKFDQGPVGRILAKDADGKHVVPNEQVPAHFFHTGATAADDIRAFVAAGGDINVIENYAGFVLRSSGIIKADSSADIDALNGWIAAHSVALSALPRFREKLDNLLAAQNALRRAKEKHEEKLTDFYSNPAALFLNNDPITAIDKLFSLPQPVEAMRDVVTFFQADPTALSGAQRAVIDYIIQCVDVDIERHPAFCEFLDENRDALAILFGEDKMRTFDDVAASLRQSGLSCQPEEMGLSTERELPKARQTRSRWASFFPRKP